MDVYSQMRYLNIYIRLFFYLNRTCGSVYPMTPMGGCEKTTVAMLLYSNWEKKRNMKSSEQ